MSLKPVFRYPIYDQLSIQNNCNEPGWFATRQPQFVKNSGCTMLGLLEAMERLGNLPLHFAGDSLTRYTYLSLRWARRRLVLESGLCRSRAQDLWMLGNTTGGLSKWFWSVMSASQGMEGD